MATQDISRSAFDPRKQYASVRMQQGRVILDDDWNENERIANEDLRRSRVDIVGPAGSPDEGFGISNLHQTADDQIDFKISAGSFYLGGNRLELHRSVSYLQQDDALQPGKLTVGAPNGARSDLAVLMTYQQPVSAVEDSELFEMALGGPDTTTRLRTMQRVVLYDDIQGDTCAEAWQALQARLEAEGKGTLNAENELIVDARLSVSFIDGVLPDDLCTPTTTGGYLGAENQAIRVQLVDDGNLTWGFDNAAPLYRVEVGSDRQTVTMLTEPKDEAHWPLAQQTVEILPWTAVLPNNEKIAHGQGHLTRVSVSYNPDTKVLTLAEPIPTAGFDDWESRGDAAPLEQCGTYYYLRVWNRGADNSADPAISFTPGTAVTLGQTGLQITLDGTQFRAGDYWIIAARPETPNRVVPWQLEKGLMPHGRRLFVSPLALIQWPPTGAGIPRVHDCRPRFRPLTDQKVCCSFTVGDGKNTVGDFDSIEAALQAIPRNTGGEICLLPGVHEAHVVLENRRDITIRGCDQRVLVTPRTSKRPPAIFTIRGGGNIVLEHMDLMSPDGMLVDLQALNETPPLSVTIRHNRMLACVHAVRVMDGTDVHIVDNNIRMLDKETGDVAIFMRAEESRIARNRIHMVPVAEETPPAGETPSGGRYDPYDPCDEPEIIAKPILQLYTYLEWAWADTLFQVPDSAYVAPGGIQVASTSERIEISHNRILGGAGNGISLGHIPLEEIVVFGSNRTIRNNYAVADLSADRRKALQTNFDSFLYAIRIEENEIRNMGKNGIGVVAFFSLENIGLMVMVDDLTIYRNVIENCLLQVPAETPTSMREEMGYAGICLAGADNLTVRENRIQNNGRSHLEPISGIFVLFGENVDISDNRIVANGPRTAEANQDARAGLRAGIYVGMTFKKIAFEILDGAESLFLDGIPAIKVHDNVVVQPLGQALFLLAFGPVSVVGNHLTSQGVDYQASPFSLLGGAVIIMNLGISKDLLGWLLVSSLKNAGKTALPDHMQADYMQSGKASVEAAAAPATIDLTASAATTNPAGLLLYLPSGDVLFANNRTTLDLRAPEFNFTISSQFIFSLDDVAYVGNQSECTSVLDIVLSDVIVLGTTVRAADNRFQEGFTLTPFSLISIGLLMNTTSLNQASHCIIPLGILRSALGPRNTILYNLKYCNAAGARLSKYFAIQPQSKMISGQLGTDSNA
jgi:hypothetical protein